jgi:cell division cycle 20-like protein 1 (cofactor of APC complex)
MLRHRVREKESDRYIAARSAERDKRIEKYQISDEICKIALNLVDCSTPVKKRTLSIIVDDKYHSNKLYLSLLKTQIFNTNSSAKRTLNISDSKHTSKKKKKVESSKKTKLANSSEKNILTLNESNIYKIDNIAKDLDEENIKPSFKRLINFDIEDDTYPLFANKISTSPYKVLDSPNLKDDFYLHLVDWSRTNQLAVGLEKSIYLWDGNNSNVNQLYTYSDEFITSVRWLCDNKLLIGTNLGKTHSWDIEKSKIISTYSDHTERISVIAKWNNDENIFTTGSQDKNILSYDFRQISTTFEYNKHTQEVCGLKWSYDNKLLASGGNDNKLLIWNINKASPEGKFSSHKSAVKAIDWSPYKYGYLVSGGGTQDRTIKIWNTNTMTMVDSIDTGSQVCNIAFSRISKEMVSTHGYSDNLILLWDCEKMDVKATLKGHKDRVIYLSVGPDGRKIVTGAGDETLRFWDLFTPEMAESEDSSKLKHYNIR